MKYEKLKLYRDNYMDLCMAHQRKITQSDSYCLQDGRSAGRWYSNQLYKIYEWRKEEKQLTEKQMECLMLIAELDNFLYDHFDKLKIYERRIEEYRDKFQREGKVSQKSLFSDGILMYYWYKSEEFKYQKWYQEQKELSKNEYTQMMMFAELENDIYDKKKAKQL